ncbi:MAG: lysophospholipid acyltransferase family protein [Sinobacteraceae bacterium]|nr:lysophospholipid acyltransferase family protein [Nevskiaceae bacterium]
MATPQAPEVEIQPAPQALRAPRWWPAWLGLGLLRLLSWLPLPLLRLIGAGAGELFHALVPSRRRIVRINIRLAFPELDEKQRRHLAHRHFRALGMGFMEMPCAWFASDKRLRRCCAFVGTEHLRQAQADGAGVLLLTGHFTTMELGCRLVALAGFPFHGMYRPADNPFVDYWMRRLRERQLGLPMVPKQDLRQIVRYLRRGGRVWYGPDQTLEVAGAVQADFFGVPTLTLTATSRLAQMGHCKVVPYFPQRIGSGWRARYRVVFKPALEMFPSGDDAADARRINALLEDMIREVPEQYFWVHRKFKDGMNGAQDPYAR